jgi:iron complex outermembrane receptor protein
VKKWLTFFFSFFMAAYAMAQQTSLEIRVSDNQNRPIVGATVSLPATKAIAVSDVRGIALFKDVSWGSYLVAISAKGYGDFQKQIEVTANGRKYQMVLQPLAIKPKIEQLETVQIKGNAHRIAENTESRAIDIVNQQFIQKHLGGSLMKTLERLPGISNIGIGSGQSKPLIRGLGFNRVVVVDRGIKHEGQQWGADHGLEIDQFATGDIEVVKGPSSFAFGSDAIGGAIHLKPLPIPVAQGFDGSIQLLAKSNNHHYGTSINLSNSGKKWYFDGRFTYQDYADYRLPTDTVYVYDYAVRLHQNRIRNTAGKETGLHFTAAYRGKQVKSALYFSNSYAKSGFFANAHGLEPRRVDEVFHDKSDRDLQSPYQRVNHMKLISRSEFNHENAKTTVELGLQKNFRQEFNHYVNHGYMPPIYPSELQIPSNLEREYHKMIYSANVKHQLNVKKHQLQIGVNTDYQDNNISGWSFLIPAFQQFNAGLFVYDKLTLSNQLILHAALRYDYGYLQFERYDDWFVSERVGGNVTTYEKLTRAHRFGKNFSSVVWSAGVNYNPGKFSLKANIGRSFRMPIAKELASNGVNYHYFSYEKGNANLDPEVAYQIDLGLSWSEDKWQVVLSPFYNYFPNYIYLNPTPYHDYYYGAGNQVFEYTQSKVERYGAELKVNYQILPSFSTELLGEYLYSEQLSGDKKGYTLPFSPAPSALLNLTWSPQVSERIADTYFSVDYRLTAPQNNIVPPEKKTPGYQVVNVQLGTTVSVNNQRFEFNLQVQNLLNAKYLNHTSFYRLIELPDASQNFILSLKIPLRNK